MVSITLQCDRCGNVIHSGEVKEFLERFEGTELSACNHNFEFLKAYRESTVRMFNKHIGNLCEKCRASVYEEVVKFTEHSDPDGHC